MVVVGGVQVLGWFVIIIQAQPHLIPDDVEAVKDVWLVGDKMLRTIYATLPAMRRESKLAKLQEPYLYKYYNVKRYYADLNNYTGNALERIQNALIKAINDNQHLPRFLLVFPDRDLITSMGKEFIKFGVGDALGRIVDKLIANVDRIVNNRKTDLYFKRPGAISPGEPKFIWIKMIRRPNEASNSVQSVRTKFNSILEKAITGKRHNYILDFDGVLSNDSFDRNAELNPTGMIEAWLEIDRKIQMFDKQQLSLKPECITVKKGDSNNHPGSGDFNRAQKF